MRIRNPNDDHDHRSGCDFIESERLLDRSRGKRDPACGKLAHRRVFAGDSRHGGGAIAGGWGACETCAPKLVERLVSRMREEGLLDWEISVYAVEHEEDPHVDQFGKIWAWRSTSTRDRVATIKVRP